MKVFQVKIDYAGIGDEIIERVQYVTHKENNILAVTSHFSRLCDELEEDLKSVAEVLTVSEQLSNKESASE